MHNFISFVGVSMTRFKFGDINWYHDERRRTFFDALARTIPEGGNRPYLVADEAQGTMEIETGGSFLAVEEASALQKLMIGNDCVAEYDSRTNELRLYQDIVRSYDKRPHYFTFGQPGSFRDANQKFMETFGCIADLKGWNYDKVADTDGIEWLKFNTNGTPFTVSDDEDSAYLYLKTVPVARFDKIQKTLTSDEKELGRVWRLHQYGDSEPESTAMDIFSFGPGTFDNTEVQEFIDSIERARPAGSQPLTIEEGSSNSLLLHIDGEPRLSIERPEWLLMDEVCIAEYYRNDGCLYLPSGAPGSQQVTRTFDNRRVQEFIDSIERARLAGQDHIEIEEEDWDLLLIHIDGAPHLSIKRFESLLMGEVYIAEYEFEARQLYLSNLDSQQVTQPAETWHNLDAENGRMPVVPTMTAGFVLQVLADSLLVAAGVVLMVAGIIGLAGMPILGITGVAAVGALAGGVAATCTGFALLKSAGLFGGAGGGHDNPDGAEAELSDDAHSLPDGLRV